MNTRRACIKNKIVNHTFCLFKDVEETLLEVEKQHETLKEKYDKAKK